MPWEWDLNLPPLVPPELEKLPVQPNAAVDYWKESTLPQVHMLKTTQNWRCYEDEREIDALLAQVSFQWNDPDFLLKNPDFLLRNPDLLLKNVDFTIKTVLRVGEVYKLRTCGACAADLQVILELLHELLHDS